MSHHTQYSRYLVWDNDGIPNNMMIYKHRRYISSYCPDITVHNDGEEFWETEDYGVDGHHCSKIIFNRKPHTIYILKVGYESNDNIPSHYRFFVFSQLLDMLTKCQDLYNDILKEKNNAGNYEDYEYDTPDYDYNNFDEFVNNLIDNGEALFIYGKYGFYYSRYQNSK